MAYRGDLIGCTVKFELAKDGKVPIVFYLNGRQITEDENEILMEYTHNGKLYPYIGMGHTGLRVLAKVSLFTFIFILSFCKVTMFAYLYTSHLRAFNKGIWAFLDPIDFPLCKALTFQVTCSFLFNFVKAIRVRSRCSYHDRYHHRFVIASFHILVSFLAFLCQYPAITHRVLPHQ